MSAMNATPGKTASMVMTHDVVSIPAEATLQEVAMLLTTRHISGAPVVDENGDMIGIISEADLLSETRRRAGLPQGAAFGIFFLPQETVERIYHHGATLLAREVMTSPVLTVNEDTPLAEVIQLMVNEHINRIPVLRGTKVVGIITRSDLLRALFMSPSE
jgi:CBS domain-containing protein